MADEARELDIGEEAAPALEVGDVGEMEEAGVGEASEAAGAGALDAGAADPVGPAAEAVGPDADDRAAEEGGVAEEAEEKDGGEVLVANGYAAAGNEGGGVDASREEVRGSDNDPMEEGGAEMEGSRQGEDAPAGGGDFGGEVQNLRSGKEGGRAGGDAGEDDGRQEAAAWDTEREPVAYGGGRAEGNSKDLEAERDHRERRGDHRERELAAPEEEQRDRRQERRPERDRRYRDGDDRDREPHGRGRELSPPPRKDHRDRSRSPPPRDRDRIDDRHGRERDGSERRGRYESPPHKRDARERDRFDRDRERERGGDRYDRERGDRYVSRNTRRASPSQPLPPPAIAPRRRNNGLGRPGRQVFVAGMSFAVAEGDLERKFSRYGKVVTSRVMRDSRTRESRGFGFVTFEYDDEADACIESLDQAEWNGRILFVEKAKTGARG